MVEFYIKTTPEGKPKGPFSDSKVKALAAKGKLKPQHLISQDKKNWKPAGQLCGLQFGKSSSESADATNQPEELPESSVNKSRKPVSMSKLEATINVPHLTDIGGADLLKVVSDNAYARIESNFSGLKVSKSHNCNESATRAVAMLDMREGWKTGAHVRLVWVKSKPNQISILSIPKTKIEDSVFRVCGPVLISFFVILSIVIGVLTSRKGVNFQSLSVTVILGSILTTVAIYLLEYLTKTLLRAKILTKEELERNDTIASEAFRLTKLALKENC